MGMTNKQFQGFVRLTLAQIERALNESPDNKELQEMKLPGAEPSSILRDYGTFVP